MITRNDLLLVQRLLDALAEQGIQIEGFEEDARLVEIANRIGSLLGV